MNVHFYRRRADGAIIETGNCAEKIFQLLRERRPDEYFRDDGTAQLTPPPLPLPADVVLAAIASPNELTTPEVLDIIETRLSRIEARLDALEK